MGVLEPQVVERRRSEVVRSPEHALVVVGGRAVEADKQCSMSLLSEPACLLDREN